MTDIRKAVARAICDAIGDDPDIYWHLFKDAADAAIAAHIDAIMVPSHAMVRAGGKGCVATWWAMLTAMRNEK